MAEIRRRSWAEPFKIKVVEPLKITTRAEREAAIREAGYNTFLLKSEDVYIDLLTDSGTSAMSDAQWAAMMMGDEAYAGSKNFYFMCETIEKYYGYRHVIPTHQGRGAEHILSQVMIRPGDVVPGNMYFTTTKVHQELAGGKFVDVIIDEAHDPESTHPFKGNIDLAKLDAVVKQVGAERVPYVSFEGNVNMAGGQPVSLANFKEVYEYCAAKGIKVMLDATRLIENAYFIKIREAGQGERTIEAILREICSYADGMTMSSKKDHLVNIGGFLAVNDEAIAQKAREMVVIYEGLHTYGGMAGRDMQALAQGIIEAVQFDHMRARVGQVEYLGQKLLDHGIPIVVPIGGHAVYLNAKKFLPHIDQDQFPAQALAAELYLDSGVRAMERGNVSAGRGADGKNMRPRLELVRLTIPRRVYTQAHMDVTWESICDLYEKRDAIRGLRFTYEPDTLRFFQARFEPV
ncbi:MAG: tyrosine phenol-lyase [Deltaproteobacteria bacterium]|nr:tyrosine phenol-lyase [Deltaproteobacteria bacterium]